MVLEFSYLTIQNPWYGNLQQSDQTRILHEDQLQKIVQRMLEIFCFAPSEHLTKVINHVLDFLALDLNDRGL